MVNRLNNNVNIIEEENITLHMLLGVCLLFLFQCTASDTTSIHGNMLVSLMLMKSAI